MLSVNCFRGFPAVCYPTVEDIRKALLEKALSGNSTLKKENTNSVLMDVSLKIRNADDEWIPANPNDFPEDGVEVLLPHIMEYYLPVSTPRLARMAQICGISGDSDESTRARAFVESIAAMNQTGGVPERLAEFPRAEIDAVIKEAFQECHGTYPVPRYYTRPAARALLEQVCAE